MRPGNGEIDGMDGTDVGANGLLAPCSGLLEVSRGLLEVTIGLVVRAAVVLFIHFSMWPLRTSLRLNFLPHSLHGYEAVMPHSYL
jgi:hypothetical protein